MDQQGISIKQLTPTGITTFGQSGSSKSDATVGLFGQEGSAFSSTVTSSSSSSAASINKPAAGLFKFGAGSLHVENVL